jgi:hypothetical protein
MRNVIIAGLLGGLIGGGGAFAAVRWAPSKSSTAQAQMAADPGAKAIPESLMGKLQANDPDGFAADARSSMHVIPEPEFAAFKASLIEFRQWATNAYGKPLGQCELIREQAAGPDVVRVIYLEKFEKGGVAWYFHLYHGAEGWKLASVNWDRTLTFAFAGSP